MIVGSASRPSFASAATSGVEREPGDTTHTRTPASASVLAISSAHSVCVAPVILAPRLLGCSCGDSERAQHRAQLELGLRALALRVADRDAACACPQERAITGQHTG